MSKKYSPYQQAQRQNRMLYFEQEVLPFIAINYDVSAPNEHCYKVVDTPKGEMTIYPKGDKIQLSTQGRWVSSDIVNWLGQTLIQEPIKSYNEWLKNKR